MKKPIVILTTLVTVTASAVALFVPTPSGAPGPDHTNQTVNGLTKGGLMSPAQAEMLKKMQAAAAGHASEANSVMAGPSQQPAPGRPAMQQPANGPAVGPNGAVVAPPPPPPAEPKIPGWRLEGTVVGGSAKPSAIFMIEGWGQVVIHAGEKLNEITKVVSIKGNLVTLRTKDKKTLRVAPW